MMLGRRGAAVCRRISSALPPVTRLLSTTHTGFQVALIGAAGGIGQPLSLLLKLDSLVSELRLLDVVNTPGVAADLSHIPTPTKVVGYKGADQMEAALSDADLTITTAGMPRRPGMTRQQLFDINAAVVKSVAEAAARVAPRAMHLVVTNPINSTTPIFAEVLKQAGVYDPRRLFGLTTLDVIRAETFVAENQGWDCRTTKVPVVGGHAGTTILPVRPECRERGLEQRWCDDCTGECTSIIPLLSQVSGARFSEDDVARLTHHIQFGGDEVVLANEGCGSATLSMAHAGHRFAHTLMRAMGGAEEDLVEYAFVENDLTEAPFFAAPVTLGPEGIERVHPLGPLSAMERRMVERAVPDLIQQAEMGVRFVTDGPLAVASSA